MKTVIIKYIYLILIILTIGFVLGSCGGDNSGLSPNINSNPTNSSSLINPTPTPVLSNVPVSGYIFANNIVTDEGETISSINILDVPAFQSNASGNEPFVTQVANSLKEDYPEDWAKAEIQELYAQLNKTLSESKPLSEINGQVYSVYADSQSATPIPVSSDGHFDNTVLTGAADSTVKLEVALGEDSYAEVETLPSSGDINSSDATNAVLKSCPEKIFAFPGEIVIFKVQAEPGINLKSAGLKFTLENPSIGCLTQPVYLCIFGKNKYQTSYGCLYVKKGLNTPLASNIIATTNTGLSLKIFTEIIKSTASISGTIYTNGMPLVKGFVHSLGPKACCKLDPNGTYTLPKVFRGHTRAVIATWWTTENGKKVRHREEKVIDFFDQDLTGFNFGVPPVPTATPTPRPPYDEFYNKKVSTVLYQYNQWETELGKDEAIQRIITWLNGELPNGPPVPDEIAGASLKKNPYDIWIHFRDSMSVCVSTSDTIIVEEPDPNEEPIQKEEIKPISRLIASSKDTTVKNADVLILSPYYWQKDYGDCRVEGRIKETLIANNYNVTCKMPADKKDFYFDWDHPVQDNPKYQDPNKPLVNCYIKSASSWDNIVTPWDIEDMWKYGIIYIDTHGWTDTVDPNNPDSEPNSCVMSCTIDVRNWYGLTRIDTWVLNNAFSTKNTTGFWFYTYRDIAFSGGMIQDKPKGWVRELTLTDKYFTSLNNNPAKNFEGSLIYLSCCRSYGMQKYFSSAKVYLGNRIYGNSGWTIPFAYYFFWFMMNGPEGCAKDDDGSLLRIVDSPAPDEGKKSFDEDIPMDAHEALKQLSEYYKVNPDPNPYPPPMDARGKGCSVKIWQKDPNEHIYFPVPVTVTIERK
jgi:hypothetical protein